MRVRGKEKRSRGDERRSRKRSALSARIITFILVQKNGDEATALPSHPLAFRDPPQGRSWGWGGRRGSYSNEQRTCRHGSLFRFKSQTLVAVHPSPSTSPTPASPMASHCNRDHDKRQRPALCHRVAEQPNGLDPSLSSSIFPLSLSLCTRSSIYLLTPAADPERRFFTCLFPPWGLPRRVLLLPFPMPF
jgi:hypothetical protein